MEPKCSIDSSHIGPFALYFWKEQGKYGMQHRSVLCEECARRVGAWKLSAKVEEEEEELIFDDTPQPNNNLRGNPYQ